jgi:tetratricopeptide (TPR) repeat protein
MADTLKDMTAADSLSLADSYQADENYTEAVDAYAAAISLLRDSEVALHLRALSHRSAAFFKLGRYEEALEDATGALELLSEKSSELRPGEGELCHKRSGQAAFQLKKYELAKQALEKAAQLAKLNNRPDAGIQEMIRQCEEKLNPTPPPAAKPHLQHRLFQRPLPNLLLHLPLPRLLPLLDRPHQAAFLPCQSTSITRVTRS